MERDPSRKRTHRERAAGAVIVRSKLTRQRTVRVSTLQISKISEPALYLQMLPNAYDGKVCRPLQARGHASCAADQVTQHNIGQSINTCAREKRSWQSEQSHASKDDYYTHCMRKEKRPEGHVHKKEKWRRGKAGIENTRTGEEKHDSSIRPP